jgi:hypothetical protein
MGIGGLNLANVLVAGGAALIGALSGKLWDAAIDRKRERHILVIRYLSQLQTSVEMLEDRLRNLTEESGQEVMSPDYFHFSTLYALACPLAMERIFMLDGIYPQIRAFNKVLYWQLYNSRLDSQLRGFGFHRYDRVALAECAMGRDDSGLRLATYFEFRSQYEQALARKDEWLGAASEFANLIMEKENRTRIQGIRNQLMAVANELAKHTLLGVQKIQSGR